MEEIKKQLDKLPEAIKSYDEGELTAIGIIIMKYALRKLSGQLRTKVIKLALLLVDLDEEFINPK